jgi:type I restriction enzyme M protein
MPTSALSPALHGLNAQSAGAGPTNPTKVSYALAGAPLWGFLISRSNRLSELGDRERFDVIATNPPFGGEEEPGNQNDFPDDKRTSETALLFLQLIMRQLRRRVGGKRGGRAGVVVPNGTLFAGGVAARIKEELLREFNLHTIVRLPNGVFAPYTSIPTNVLFFARGGPTREVWYYEQPLPEGRKQYTKTAPIQLEEFAPVLAWWGNREENERARRVSAETIAAEEYNLDRKNPHGRVDFAHLPPEQLVEDILAKERRILALMDDIRATLAIVPTDRMVGSVR